MKKIICLLLVCGMLSACFALPGLAEENWNELTSYSAEQLSAFPAGTAEIANARTLQNGQLVSAKGSDGKLLNAPVDTVAGYSQKMFGSTYIAWGFCTPNDGNTHNIKVVADVGLYSFDDVNWHVSTDGYLNEIAADYDDLDMVGFELAHNKIWLSGSQYNESPTKISEKGYSYKEFTFNYTGIAPWSEGVMWFGWDQNWTPMSMVLNKVTYYDSDTGEMLRQMNEKDIAYGTLDNLTGIVHTDHTYTSDSCGEVLTLSSNNYLISGVTATLKKGNYRLKLTVNAKDTYVEFSNSSGLINRTEVKTDGLQEMIVPVTVSADGEYSFAIRQLQDEIALQSISILQEPPKYTLGDVDGNGLIEPTDALLTLRGAIGKTTLDETQTLAANVDAAGTAVTVTDALLILRYSIKKITSFPIEK